jgi:hypothetical protein
MMKDGAKIKSGAKDPYDPDLNNHWAGNSMTRMTV